ncbi:hypothetical protein KEC56_13615 [Microbacterium sp. YMB-B2]|uniref:Uncharacterized protein n=1 Tax=Microbacterium tenebrionis TaxID=2830665 RepID=A0A9X1LR12_9MICO|nr:hypothetical protein [Microbacterium tenebrionis]MCC2030532.1 hypothetical protein [Microbacterium tenebrionis]
MDIEARVTWLSKQSIGRVQLAQERSNALLADVSRWRKPEPIKTTLHCKEPPECGWYVEVDSVDPPPRLEQWGVQLGEIAHHLRSILNTTLNRIVKADGGTPAKSLQYPVAYSAAQWRGAMKRGQLRGLPERVVRAVYACQPFVWANASGTNPADNVLAVLAWLNNEDKHRMEIGGTLAGRWVEYEGRIITPDGVSVSMRPKMVFDWSLEQGTRIVDADTSPHVTADIGRTTLDMQIDVLVADEQGKTTVLEELLEEIWSGFQQAQVTMMVAWADVDVDLNRFAGATDFQQGSAFGRAAVDAVVGNGAWDNDFVRRQMKSPPGLGSEVEGDDGHHEDWKFEADDGLRGDASAVRGVEWASLRGVRDAHALPRTWRGEAD